MNGGTISAADEAAQLRSLARRIVVGNCILVLGPGAASIPGQSPEVPLSVELSRQLAADENVVRNPGLDVRDLRHVSQLLYEATRDLTSLQERVAEFYGRYAGQTTPFHRAVAALPFKFCLTTTPDDFLFTALTEAGKKPQRDFFNFRRARPADLVTPPTVERPLVYHLYGHREDPDSLVITENDLIDFLAAVVKNTPPLALVVRGELAKATTTCLFVDLGFKNWYLRALLRALGLFGHNDSSVAIEGAEFFQQSELRQTMLYFSASQAIQFREAALGVFASRLRETWETMAGKNARPAPTLPEGAARAFVSYVEEDRAAVEQLGESLRAAGIAVWQDHQNLRVGDRWPTVLVDVIQKKVDYVIVVQSPNLERRDTSYVGIELSEALRRDAKNVWKYRFILPVTLGETKRLPGLEALHQIDVSSAEGVRALIATIRDDWQQRAERRA